jgi:hypothetical protein
VAEINRSGGAFAMAFVIDVIRRLSTISPLPLMRRWRGQNTHFSSLSCARHTHTHHRCAVLVLMYVYRIRRVPLSQPWSCTYKNNYYDVCGVPYATPYLMLLPSCADDILIGNNCLCAYDNTNFPVCYKKRGSQL